MHPRKTVSTAALIALAALLIPCLPHGTNPGALKGSHPILSEHPPSPFKMPKPGGNRAAEPLACTPNAGSN